MGAPDIIPLNFKNAIIEPEKVIAPIAAPNDISIRLASLIFPTEPRLNASGFRNADIATIGLIIGFIVMMSLDVSLG